MGQAMDGETGEYDDEQQQTTTSLRIRTVFVLLVVPVQHYWTWEARTEMGIGTRHAHSVVSSFIQKGKMKLETVKTCNKFKK